MASPSTRIAALRYGVVVSRAAVPFEKSRARPAVFAAHPNGAGAEHCWNGSDMLLPNQPPPNPPPPRCWLRALLKSAEELRRGGSDNAEHNPRRDG